MKKIGHKLLATMMTLTFLTVTAVPAFAETTTTPPSQVEKTDKIKFTPEEAKARLLERIQKIEEGREDMAPIRELRTQVKDLRSQINEVRKANHQGFKNAKDNKDKATLLEALESLVKVKDDVIAIKDTAAILKADHTKLKTDRAAKDSAAIATDLTNIETHLTALIDQEKQVLADLNATNLILSKSTS